MTSFTLEWDRFRLELGPVPCIMGILNTTPDSFSDGGHFFETDKAVAHGLQLVEDGAHILDIGGESTRPFAQPVSADQEMARVIPVIERLADRIDVPISIDTTKADVAREALKAGAAIINDISALEKDPRMTSLAAETGAPVILMHMKGTPETMQISPSYDDLIREVSSYLEERIGFAVDNGIRKDRIIVDPGIGFGKTVEHNLMLIRHLDRLCALGYPVLMGPSRKSFIQKLLSKSMGKEVKALSNEAAMGTLGASAASFVNGAHIVRVHDVASLSPLLRIMTAVQKV